MGRLTLTREKRTLVLTIDNPSTKNALTPAIYQEGIAALEAAASDSGTGAIVLRGANGTFCSGGNLQDIAQLRAAGEKAVRGRLTQLHSFVRAIRSTPIPVIAAVEGWAAGAGFSLALACDMIVAAKDARFVLAYVRVGLSPDGGGTASLGRVLPRQLAAEIAMTGDPIGADRLHALGVINELVDPGEAFAAALARATRLAAGPRAAIGSIKTLLDSAQLLDFSDQLDRELDAFARNAITGDAGEGISAFLEKRTPRFGSGH